MNENTTGQPLTATVGERLEEKTHREETHEHGEKQAGASPPGTPTSGTGNAEATWAPGGETAGAGIAARAGGGMGERPGGMDSQLRHDKGRREGGTERPAGGVEQARQQVAATAQKAASRVPWGALAAAAAGWLLARSLGSGLRRLVPRRKHRRSSRLMRWRR